MRDKFQNKTQQNTIRCNQQISAPFVFVIFGDKKIGTLPIRDAKALAYEEGLDLIEVSPTVNPPVCLIVDYSKWKYDKQKKVKQQKQKTPALKEVQLSPCIDEHDLATKLANLKKFLEGGHSVLVSVNFKGRQRAHVGEGERVIAKIIESVQEIGKPDNNPSLQGKRMSVRISPKK